MTAARAGESSTKTEIFGRTLNKLSRNSTLKLMRKILFSGTTALNPRPKISPRRCKAEARIWAMEEKRRTWVTDKDRQLETATKEARQKFLRVVGGSKAKLQFSKGSGTLRNSSK